MHNQHEAYINLVRWESKKHLRLPGSIWDAEREAAALPAFLLKWRNSEVLLLLLIQLWAFFRPAVLPHRAPGERSLEPQNDIIKMLLRKRMDQSGWEAHSSSGTKQWDLGMWGRDWFLSSSVPTCWTVLDKFPHIRALVFLPVKWNDWPRWLLMTFVLRHSMFPEGNYVKWLHYSLVKILGTTSIESKGKNWRRFPQVILTPPQKACTCKIYTTAT